MNLKVSVIVPIYNVENYVKKCVDSIINQTYDNIEIILINDGSTDNSKKIIDEAYGKRRNVFIYNKKNGGLSSARNYGLKKISGEYVMFVDSDDWIDIDCIDTLVKYIKKYKEPDIIEFGYRNVNDNGIINESNFKFLNINEKNNILKEYFYGSNIIDIVCNKIYKRELFNNIKFIENRIHEDYIITPQLLYGSNNICIIQDIFYNYYQRSNSITNCIYNEKKLDRLYAGEYVVNFCKENATQFTDIAKIRYAFICIYSYNDLVKADNISKIEFNCFKEKILNQFKELHHSVKKCADYYKIPFHKRLFLELFNINKKVTLSIYNLLRSRK